MTESPQAPERQTGALDFWPSCGFAKLARDPRGWLQPTDDYLRLFLARPELALVPESCAAETRLHEALLAAPARPVGADELAALADDDARDNYAMFIGFRDALLDAGTLEAYYIALFRSGAVTIPPLFVDFIAQAILRNILDDSQDAFEARAAEMLFRRQRISVQDGQLLAADRDVVEMHSETGGLGEIGRLLTQAKAPLRALQMEVLSADNGVAYWQADTRHNFLLDLTHEVTQDLSHGLILRMTKARSGLKALARVLEKWIAHLLGVVVRIQPERKIDDAQWRWHVGLDAESSALLNDLYEDRPVDADRMDRIVSLFRLEFANRAEMRPDVSGKPVYLGLAMDADKILRIKPQNLLLNLPLARSS
ncbi:MAG: DUF6352 family protein [Rubrivivax sp.]|nr:DUF6352 family protein [Rubrivivax sp.]